MLSVAIAVALVAPASGDLRGTDAVARSIVYDGFALPAREDSVPLSRSLTGRSMAGRLQETVRALARAFRVPSVPQRARRARTAGVRVLVITWLGIWPRSSTRGGSLLGAAHLALDVAGAVPVVGEPADLANAAIYAAEGDATMATLSAGAAVPIAGWGATGAKGVVRAGDEVGDASTGGGAAGRSSDEPSSAGSGPDEPGPRLIYEHNPKHGPVARQGPRGEISRAPRGDCQAMLECSILVKPNLRKGVEPETGAEVIFRRHRVFENTEWWHGYVPGG